MLIAVSGTEVIGNLRIYQRDRVWLDRAVPASS
jgi:hypothetical protein